MTLALPCAPVRTVTASLIALTLALYLALYAALIVAYVSVVFYLARHKKQVGKLEDQLNVVNYPAKEGVPHA